MNDDTGIVLAGKAKAVVIIVLIIVAVLSFALSFPYVSERMKYDAWCYVPCSILEPW